MAHRTDVTQVPKEFPRSRSAGETVHDPQCGRSLARRDARSVLFTGGDPIYFCSKECREKYRAAKRSRPAAA
jgi:YHS domain-containing protein